MSSPLRWLYCAAVIVSLSGCAVAVVGVAAVTSIDVVHDRRTFGEYVDDGSIEFTLRQFIILDDELRTRTHLSVTSMNGILLLTGEAPSNELRDKVVSHAGGVEGVRQVVNEIRISGKTGYISRTNDTWLTTKVKSTLFAKTKLDANRIKVVSEFGTVYLMGVVKREEADRATQIVREIGGVTQVVQVFEFLD